MVVAAVMVRVAPLDVATTPAAVMVAVVVRLAVPVDCPVVVIVAVSVRLAVPV